MDTRYPVNPSVAIGATQRSVTPPDALLIATNLLGASYVNDPLALSEGSAVGSSDGSSLGSSVTDSLGVGFGAASSSDEVFDSAKIANKTIPAITRKRIPDELLFLAGAFGAAAGAAFGALVAENEEVEEEPRVGTGGMTNLDTSTVFALRFLTEVRFALFLAVRLADFLTAFFTVRLALRLAGRFAAAFLAGRFFAAAFFFVATITPSDHWNFLSEAYLSVELLLGKQASALLNLVKKA
ncbi:MAG: hypothetical protein RIR40_646 [Actinomycetota bacterium]|jgi:hypothetical protein